ncbi:hypothetical protein BGZ76_001331, partial [Entomortierella beljakovae]
MLALQQPVNGPAVVTRQPAQSELLPNSSSQDFSNSLQHHHQQAQQAQQQQSQQHSQHNPSTTPVIQIQALNESLHNQYQMHHLQEQQIHHLQLQQQQHQQLQPQQSQQQQQQQRSNNPLDKPNSPWIVNEFPPLP